MYKILSDNPLFILINSYTAGLSPKVLENILKLLIKQKVLLHQEKLV